MEKYEINKFIEEYKTKLNDLYAAFNIEKKRPELAIYEEKMELNLISKFTGLSIEQIKKL